MKTSKHPKSIESIRKQKIELIRKFRDLLLVKTTGRRHTGDSTRRSPPLSSRLYADIHRHWYHRDRTTQTRTVEAFPSISNASYLEKLKIYGRRSIQNRGVNIPSYAPWTATNYKKILAVDRSGASSRRVIEARATLWVVWEFRRRISFCYYWNWK